MLLKSITHFIFQVLLTYETELMGEIKKKKKWRVEEQVMNKTALS